ncbi:DUF2971 domain-containing protein [Vibrio cholerae]|uniref:DUF2971 domain-containing protein n=1 Tax=Vibrio navarrensis TaxID=29495 RepID=A0AAJ4IGR3_9VIBR|nr:DUF2971 domain-containing protein [Vibrio navarrensis]
MEHRLYKYMPLRMNFFENFLLRCTPKSSLNDPFEALPSMGYWEQFFEKLSFCGDGEFSVLKEQYLKDSYENDFGLDVFKEHGIISFSETHDNLLMWAHYADNHSGIVVGFDGNHEWFKALHRVRYRKERNTEFMDFNDPYLYKSDEWSYEKEHRLIVKLSSTPVQVASKQYLDSIGCNVADQSNYIDQKYLIPEHTNADLSHKDVLCFEKAPLENIKSIYVGCKVEPKYIEKIVRCLSDHNLSEVHVFKSNIDKDNFKLNFERII